MNNRTPASERLHVKNIQRYLGLPMSGRFDERLRAEIMDFQKHKGFTESGTVTFETFEAMKSGYLRFVLPDCGEKYKNKRFPMARGMIGADVEELNRTLSSVLAEHDYGGILPRGALYDEKTVYAVREIRRIFGKNEADFVDLELYIRLVREMLIAK